MSKMNIYVAGSWKNRSKIKSIMEEIENWGYDIAMDWTKHQEKGGARQYAEEDLKGLKRCDCLIYCMDSYHSRGKNFELGYITALGKPIIIYIMPGDDVSEKLPIDYLIGKECVFIKAKLYPILDSMNELRSWLDNLDMKNLYDKNLKKLEE